MKEELFMFRIEFNYSDAYSRYLRKCESVKQTFIAPDEMDSKLVNDAWHLYSGNRYLARVCARSGKVTLL